MKGKLLAFSMLLLYSSVNCYSQTSTIDRLQDNLSKSKSVSQQLHFLLLLCEERYSLSTDALHQYALKAKNLSLTTNDASDDALADYYVCNYYVKKGALDSALSMCDTYLLQLKNQPAVSNLWLKFAALKAQVLVKSNKYKEGLSAFYTALSKAEQSNDTMMQMIAKNGIGWVNMEMDQNLEALRWFYNALHTSNNRLYHQENANIYANIAAIYIATNKLDSAKLFVEKAIALSGDDDNLFFLSNSLNILADIYIHLNKPALAEVPLEEAIKIREQIGDPFYIVSDLSQLALFYAEQSEPEKGIAASLRGIALAKKYKLISKLPYLQFALAKNYKAAGNYLKYGETLEEVLSLKNSVFQQNTEQELAEIKASYNEQKQQNVIMQQKLALNKKNSTIMGAVIVLFFIMVISIIVLISYRRKQKLIVKNIREEEKRKSQLAILAAEENERKRISADLHDNLGAYASAISSNVDDLVSINGGVSNNIIHNIKSNADDILNSLSETIWVLNKSEIHLTSVSDRFKNYVSRIRDSYPDISININENIILDTVLSPESALNMLRIMQEAFHNAVKHSNGDTITIDIASSERIEISITDNGEGFSDMMTATGTGNGLNNMQRRAKANGWSLVIKRAKRGGTTVELVA